MRKLLQEASLSPAALKTTNNCYVIKCFFRVTFLLAKKHWACTYNFNFLVELIAKCGGKEVGTLTAPKNANYMSPLFIAKYISIINHYIEELLLASLRTNKYSLYNDETQDITSVEQMAIYTSFEHNGKISEHYVGILPLSKLVGTNLSANILKVLQSYLEKQEVPIDSSRFFMMDTTNVNSRENGGLKRLLQHVIPIAAWIGCGSHEVAFCFKHLLNEFPSVADADATLLAL